MEQELYYMLQELMLNIILGIVVLASGYVLSYIKAKVAEAKLKVESIKDEKLKAILKEALGELERLTGMTVKAIEGEIAKDLREALKDGLIEKKELEALSKKAYEDIVHMLKPEYLEVLIEGTNDIDLYIKDLIEAKLEELKLEKLKVIKG